MVVVGRLAVVVGVLLAFGFAGCGDEDSDGDGSGGAPNTCPPTLVNYGSGPGIVCEEPVGTTCSDTEQFCLCGQSGIEGSPWLCVPTSAGCPSTMRQGEPCNANHPDSCEYLDSIARWRCTCVSNVWSCTLSPCPDVYPGEGAFCSAPSQTCEFFRPAYAGQPEPAGNVTCRCAASQTWSCGSR